MIRPGVKGGAIAVAQSGDTVLAMPRLGELEAAIDPPAREVQP